MSRNNHNQLQLPVMDHIQPKNGPQNEPLPLDHKLLVHHGTDTPLRIGPSGHGSMALKSIDFPSSSHATEFLGYRVGNSGASHASTYHYPPGSSSIRIPEPALSYPHRSDEGFAPVSSHLDNRRAAMKRKNPIIHPMEDISTGDYYVGSSFNAQLSNYVPPNPTPVPEPLHPQMPCLGQNSWDWDGQHLTNEEGFKRNVRARHNHNISLAPRLASAYAANGIHHPSLRATGSASLSTSVERNQAPVSMPTRNVSSGITSRDLMERPYYSAMGSSNSSVSAVLPTLHGSSGSAIFANGSYAPGAVHSGTVPVYSHPASSGSRTMPRQMVIRSYPPGTSAATTQVGQALPTRAAASSRNARNGSIGPVYNGRNRRARSSYYGFHPSMMEVQRLMLDQLVFYESREPADPHRDMRFDVDNMSYEDLLALGDFIGNVNTGLADEKISKCVKEIVCCSSDQTQSNQDDDGSCIICMEDYMDKDLLGVLKCSHDFHAGCIKKWLQRKNSCPVCKAAAA